MPTNTSRRRFLAGSAGAAAGALAPPGLVRAKAPPDHLGLPIGPLSLDAMTRDTWGIYDPLVIAKLAPAAQQPCYQHKFYKSPLTPQEVLPPFGFVTQTLRITPGSLLYGIYLPSLLSSNPAFQAPFWNIQITDKSGTEDYNLFDQPIPAFFLANARVTYQTNLPFPNPGQYGSSPNLLAEPYPITGNGLLLIQLWETSGHTQRVEAVFGVLELVS